MKKVKKDFQVLLETISPSIASLPFVQKICQEYQHNISTITPNWFIPSKDRIDKEIENLSCEEMVSSLFQLYDSMLSFSQDILKNEKKEILSGSKKNRLTQWWLDKIKRQCMSFLQEIGYDIHAVPEDYIDTPPPSMAQVSHNLSLIQKLLDRSTDHFQMEDKLIRPLKEEIYKKIDSFVSQAKHVADDMKLDIELSDPQVASEEEQTQLGNLLKDLKYVEEMKILEFDYFNQTEIEEKGKLSDVVPVTGLILSRFHRLHNELDTVIHHWKGRR